MNTRSLVALTLLAAAFAQSGAQTYDLSPRFKAGDKTVYELTFTIQGQDVETIYKAKIQNEIVDVKENGDYITASYQTDHRLVIAGKEEKSAATEITEVTTYDKYGRPTAIGGDMTDPASFRLANLSSFISPRQPVAVGGSWTAEIAADSDNGIRKVQHSYTLLRITKIDDHEVAEVQLSVKETASDHPATAKGKVWVDLKTGETIKYQVSVKNMLIGPNYIDATVLIEKVSPAS